MDYSTFYERNYQRVVNYLAGKCANRYDAEDLASQVFTYCYVNWSKYDPTKATMESWLYLIVRSRWKNYCRDRMVMSDIDEFSEVLHDDRDFAEEAVNVDALRAGLAQALKQLTEQQRKVVILRYFRHATDQEIALRLRLTSANVRVIAHRALKSMESSLKGQGVWSD